MEKQDEKNDIESTEEDVQPFEESTPTPEPSQETLDESPKNEEDEKKWQERLLPLMVGLLVGLTLFFFIATFIQMSYLHRNISQMVGVDLSSAMEEGWIDNAKTFSDQLAARQLEVKSKLESYLVENRYRKLNVLLMSGLWLRYLGFVTGMILSLVGASFVLGKIREPAQKFKGKFAEVAIEILTTSPGLILVILGALLMFTTIKDQDTYEVQDAAVYMTKYERLYTTNYNSGLDEVETGSEDLTLSPPDPQETFTPTPTLPPKE